MRNSGIACTTILFCCCFAREFGKAQAGFSVVDRKTAVGSSSFGRRRRKQHGEQPYHHHHHPVTPHSSFQYSLCSLTNRDEIDSIFVSSSCYQRRQILLSTSPRVVGALVTLAAYDAWMPSRAVAAVTSISSSIMQQDSKQVGGGGAAGESLRRSAPNVIPGLGPSDIFYPESFVGSWNMSRQVILKNSNDDDKENIILTLNYPIRFLYSLNANGQAAAVADRGYNQAALENALKRSGTSSSSTSSTITPGVNNNVVQSYTWSASNPNDLRIYFTNGSSKEIKVTKRAASIVVNAAARENASPTTPAATTTIESSEFQRVTLDDQTVPVISARRVLTKWKVIEEEIVEGLELVYDMSSNTSFDPLAFSTQQQQQQQQPKLLSKSRLRVTRVRS